MYGIFENAASVTDTQEARMLDAATLLLTASTLDIHIPSEYMLLTSFHIINILWNIDKIEGVGVIVFFT